MEEHSLYDKPSQIYNIDESGVPLDPRTPNIVAQRGTEKVRCRVSGKKGQVTIVLETGGYMKSVLKVMKLVSLAKTDFVCVTSIFLLNIM